MIASRKRAGIEAKNESRPVSQIGIARARVLYIVFGGTLFLWGIIGYANALPTLLVSLLLTLLLLVLSFLFRRHFALYLIDFWVLAYLYLFTGEYVGIGQGNILSLGRNLEAVTEGFIVASFGATVFGYGLVVRWLFVRAGRTMYVVAGKPALQREPLESSGEHAWLQRRRVKDKGVLSIRFTSERRDQMPKAIGAFLLWLSLLVIFYVFQGVGIRALLFEGRLEQSPFVLLGAAANLFIAVLVTFPTVVAYVLRRYESPPAWMWMWLLAAAGLSVVAMVASGTRLYVGFQLGGVLFCLTNGYRFDRRGFVLFTLLFVFLMGLQVIMRNTRDSGIGNASAAEILDITRQADNYFSYEGILAVNALIHARRAYEANSRVPETLFIFYWWIPRQFWPDKPTMAGYWLIREFSSDRGYSSGHSVDGGFAMPALLDFGPVWGAVFCTLYGAGLAALEVFVWRNRDLRYPSAILAALSGFGVFFMMRSLHTSLIFLMMATLVSVVPLAVLARLSSPKHKSLQARSARR